MNLKSAESAINIEWMTGLVIGVQTLIQTVVVVLFINGEWSREASAAVINVLALFALSYGVWRKNKICAVLLALYFTLQFALMVFSFIQSKTTPVGILLYFIAMALCLYGARAVFAYHKIKQNESESGQEYVGQQ